MSNDLFDHANADQRAREKINELHLRVAGLEQMVRLLLELTAATQRLPAYAMEWLKGDKNGQG